MKKVIILVTVVFYCLLFMPMVNADSSKRNNLDLYSTAYIRVTNDKLKVNVGKTLQLKTDIKYVRKIIYVNIVNIVLMIVSMLLIIVQMEKQNLSLYQMIIIKI